MDIKSKLNDLKRAIMSKRKVRMKNTGYEYIPTALRLVYSSVSGWLYSVECIEERTNTVIHIKLSDVEL